MTVTHIVYKYRPVSIDALYELIQWELKGEEMVARRFICEMLEILASGKRLDSRVEGVSYHDRIKDIYKSPFESKESGADIVKALLKG